MNADRRRRLADALKQIEAALAIVEDCHSEENDAWVAIPENLAFGDAAHKVEAARDALDGAKDDLQQAIDKINEASE